VFELVGYETAEDESTGLISSLAKSQSAVPVFMPIACVMRGGNPGRQVLGISLHHSEPAVYEAVLEDSENDHAGDDKKTAGNLDLV